MIGVVIPTFNRKAEVLRLLQQLESQSSKLNEENFRILVVVDGSTDGTTDAIRENFPDVHITHGDGSWWYTRSINQGAFDLLGDEQIEWVLTLNDDITLDEGYLRSVLDAVHEFRRDCVIGSVGLSKRGSNKIMTSGKVFRSRCLGTTNHLIPFMSEIEVDELSGYYDTILLPGRGMLISRNVFESLEGFDEGFKQYHSDGDFTLRAIKNGFRVKISYSMVTFLNVSATSESTSYVNRSLIVLLKSYFNPVSRNYLPSKSRFSLRHGPLFCYPLRMMLFLFTSIRNVYRTYDFS